MITRAAGHPSKTEDLLNMLERGPSLLIALVREMPAARLKRRPAPEKWSVHEHACHLATVHGLFFDRLERMLKETDPAIVPYDPEDEAPDALLKMDLDTSLDRYARERAEILTRLRPLPEESWARTGRHAQFSHYSIYVMFRHLMLHDMLHGYRIEDLVLKPDW